jgi:hypothetical protein
MSGANSVARAAPDGGYTSTRVVPAPPFTAYSAAACLHDALATQHGIFGLRRISRLSPGVFATPMRCQMPRFFAATASSVCVPCQTEPFPLFLATEVTRCLARPSAPFSWESPVAATNSDVPCRPCGAASRIPIPLCRLQAKPPKSLGCVSRPGQTHSRHAPIKAMPLAGQNIFDRI